jgi:hypothetical protein
MEFSQVVLFPLTKHLSPRIRLCLLWLKLSTLTSLCMSVHDLISRGSLPHRIGRISIELQVLCSNLSNGDCKPSGTPSTPSTPSTPKPCAPHKTLARALCEPIRNSNQAVECHAHAVSTLSQADHSFPVSPVQHRVHYAKVVWYWALLPMKSTSMDLAGCCLTMS